MWKMKLAGYIAKPDGSLHAEDAAKDGNCELGKWIISESGKFSADADFQKLKSEHTRFHKAAADVIRHADAKKNVSEEIALGAKSPYAAASSAITAAIMAMTSKIKG